MIIFLPRLRIRFWVLDPVWRRFPCAPWNRIPTLDLPGRMKHPNLTNKCCLVLRRFLDTEHADFRFAAASSSSIFLSWAPMDMVLPYLFENNCWTNEEDGSIHHAWNYLWLTCPEVDFRCQHIWYGCWGPSWSYQTTILTQLCGLWTRVSSSDFCLWWSSWSLLHSLRKYTTALHIDKNLRLRQRDPHLTIYLHLGYLSSATWCWNFASGFPLSPWVGDFVLFEKKSDTSITLSHKQEQVVHPSSNSIPRNNFGFCRTVGYWRVSGTSILWGTSVRLPEIQKIHPKLIFESLKVTSKVWVLGSTQSTMLSCTTNMTISSEGTCVMNAGNQTS